MKKKLQRKTMIEVNICQKDIQKSNCFIAWQGQDKSTRVGDI